MRHKSMELSSPQLIRYISCFVVWFSFQYQPLNILPVQIPLCKTFIFSSLGLVEFQEQYANEKVQEEKASKHDEANKINDRENRIISLWPLGNAVDGRMHIQCMMHDIWPPFEA